MTKTKKQCADSPNTPQRTAVRIILLILSAAFILMGIKNGSMRDVRIKAVKICTECVGIG